MVSKNDLAKSMDTTERGEYGRMRSSSGGGAATKPSSSQSSGVRLLTIVGLLAVGALAGVALQPAISSRQFTQGAGIQQQSTPGLRRSVDDSPDNMCRYDYTIPAWSNEDYLACDPSVCGGGDKLQPMAEPSEKQRRWSSANESAYWNLFRKGSINGWLSEPHIHYVKLLTQLQHQLGVFGAVGEIGVHHGKFLMPIAGYALEAEPAIAMDLWDFPSANIDKSIVKSSRWLLANLKAVGIPESQVQLLAGDSIQLTAGNLSAQGLPSFRMFSVDGGHSMETTIHDMMLASCLLQDGGIMILDDIHNAAWQGVQEAMLHFLFANKRMVPLLLGYNKAYITTVSHVERYQQFLREQPIFKCRDKIDHESRRAIAGQVYCFSGPHYTR